MSTPAAKSERVARADLFLTLGPDAPTLCEGWTTSDLVAHLVVREHNPIAGLGIIAPPLAGLHDGAIRRAKQRRTYEDLVRRFRSGPPIPWMLIDKAVNGQEFFIHHEDVRRGGGDHTPRPETDIEDVENELWHQLRRLARFSVRGLKGVGVELSTPDGAAIQVRKTPTGGETATIVGRPGEIVLYLSGRKDAAQVKFEGPAGAVGALEDAKLGI